MNINRTKLYAAIYVLFGSAVASAPWTSAQADEQVATKVVKFADLNVQSPEGAKVLYNRIRAAADRVCQTNDGDSALWEGKRTCVAAAIDAAVKKVDAPYLTALRFGNSNVRLASK